MLYLMKWRVGRVGAEYAYHVEAPDLTTALAVWVARMPVVMEEMGSDEVPPTEPGQVTLVDDREVWR